MRPRPDPLPIDEIAVADVCDVVTRMNRSERHLVHTHLLDISRTAGDRIVSDNTNIVACRLTKDECERLRDWCDDRAQTISSFARDAVRDALRRETRSP